mgnify:CR=1 FL=1
MSTQIQQQQVQGLVQAVADIGTISGNLVSTGNTNATNLRATGFELETDITNLSGNLISTGAALTSSIASNTAAITATGSALDNLIGVVSGDLSTTGTTLLAAIANTGATNYLRLTSASGTLNNRITSTGTQLHTAINFLSGKLDNTGTHIEWISGSVDYISGRQNTNITDISYVSGKVNTVSGELIATGNNVGPRVGVNGKLASNLGLVTGSNQLYGEVQSIPNYSCSTRKLQWMGDIAHGVSTEIFLGGVAGQTAQMPSNADWAVKLVAHAKSIEPADRRGLGHVGMYMMETGFLINHEYSIAPYTQVSGIDGWSGSAAQGLKYGITLGSSGTTIGCLAITGHNNYTGTVRFHVTADVSQMITYP